MDAIIHNLIHIVVVLTLPPLLVGVITKSQGIVCRKGWPAGAATVLRLDQARSKRIGVQHHDDLGISGRAGGGFGDDRDCRNDDPANRFARTDLVHWRFHFVCLLARLGTVLYDRGGPGYRQRIRGHGRRTGSYLCVPGRTGAVPRTCSCWPSCPARCNWQTCLGVRSRRTGRWPAPHWPWCCSAGSSSCWRKTRGFHSTIRTRIWS